MSLFHPKLMLFNIYKIKTDTLRENNIKAVVFDIDNTLAYNHEEKPSDKTVDFIKKLTKENFKVIIASNNNENRVRKFCENMDVLYVHKANKPLGKKISLLLDKIGIDKKNAALVGDQIFTDVLCANLMGMCSILVKPFDDNENKFIKFKRKIENLFIKWQGDYENGN